MAHFVRLIQVLYYLIMTKWCVPMKCEKIVKGEDC